MRPSAPCHHRPSQCEHLHKVICSSARRIPIAVNGWCRRQTGQFRPSRAASVPSGLSPLVVTTCAGRPVLAGSVGCSGGEPDRSRCRAGRPSRRSRSGRSYGWGFYEPATKVAIFGSNGNTRISAKHVPSPIPPAEKVSIRARRAPGRRQRTSQVCSPRGRCLPGRLLSSTTGPDAGCSSVTWERSCHVSTGVPGQTQERASGGSRAPPSSGRMSTPHSK